MLATSALPSAYASLGLKLEVVSGASSATRPRDGDTVSVTYTGKISDENGKTFDTTDGKPPLTVRVGRGQVIPGWDAALPFVASGQCVRLTVPPVLAYGTKGKAGLVPPNSTLFFELTLVEIVADSPAARLLDAASTGDALTVVRALRDGAPVDHADRKGATALHLAASGGHIECVLRLLEANAPVDAEQGATAITPLMLAVKQAAGEPLCARLLLHARADPQKKSAKGNSGSSLMAADGAFAALAASNGGGGSKPADGPSDGEGLGIGGGMPRGWEPLRSRALWLADNRRANPRCYLDFVVASADGELPPPPTGNGNGGNGGNGNGSSGVPRVEVELFADVVPRTAENFRCLCTGEKGACSAFGGPPLHLKGNVSHRIVPGNILQAGDITTGDGRGGESIYGRSFADESFAGRAGKHKSKGLLSMANSGRNSNGSQFFITLDALPHLDGKHVVFGRVLKGMEYVEAIVGAVGTNGGVPSRKVVIADCGQL